MAKYNIIDDVFSHIDDKTLDLNTLQKLGYKLTTNNIIVTIPKDGKASNFTIHEVLSEDDKPSSFSFIFIDQAKVGVILPFPFSRYNKLIDS